MTKKAISENENSKKMHRSLFATIHDSPLLLWLLPIIGTYTALCIDMGVLNYYDIPPKYAEINPYTLYLSILWLAGSLYIMGFLISVYVGLRASKSLFNRILTSFHVFPLPLLIGVFLYIFGGEIWLAFGYSAIGIMYILLPPIFENKSISYKTRIEMRLTAIKDSTKKDADREEDHFSRSLMKLTGPFILFFLITALIIQIGYHSIKGTPVLVVKNMPSTLALKRNGDLYILKSFDPETLILHEGFSLKKLDADFLELQEVEFTKPLRSKAEAEKETKRKADSSKTVSELKADIQKLVKSLN